MDSNTSRVEKKPSQRLNDALTQMLVVDIQGKALDGVTYVLLLKEDKERIDFYKELRKEATLCGYAEDELIRAYELPSGYIFDMDLTVAKKFTERISQMVAEQNQGQTPTGDLLGDGPENRRKADIIKLGKMLYDNYKKGVTELDVALYSRNSVQTIRLKAVDENNNPYQVVYNAYAIRHWDIYTLNQHILIPMGFRVAKLAPIDILKNRNGVLFRLTLGRVD